MAENFMQEPAEAYTEVWGVCVDGPAKGLVVQVPPNAKKSTPVQIRVTEPRRQPSFRVDDNSGPEPLSHRTRTVDYQVSYKLDDSGWPDAQGDMDEQGRARHAGMWALIELVDFEREERKERLMEKLNEHRGVGETPDCGWCNRCSECCDDEGRPLPRRSDGTRPRYPDEPVPFKGVRGHGMGARPVLDPEDLVGTRVEMEKLRNAFPGMDFFAREASERFKEIGRQMEDKVGEEAGVIEFKIHDVSPDLQKLLFGDRKDSDHGD